MKTKELTNLINKRATEKKCSQFDILNEAISKLPENLTGCRQPQKKIASKNFRELNSDGLPSTSKRITRTITITIEVAS